MKKLFTKEIINGYYVIKLFGFIKITHKIKHKFENNTVNDKKYNIRYKISKKIDIVFHGSNNKIYIGENTHFINSKIEIYGDNLTLKIGNNCIFTNLYSVISSKKEGSFVTIGDDFINNESLQIYAGGINGDLTIGNNVMCSRSIVIYTHDGHNIYDKNTDEVINKPKNSVFIGDNVWLGHGTHILKNTIIPNNTVVGARSVVTKAFDEEYTAIAGNPAKVVRENVYFKRWE